MSIAQWPLTERPREKMLSRGPGALSDAELLAILLRTGSHGRNAVDLARDLLARSGSLARLLAMPFETLRQVPGLGQTKCLQFQAALEVARRMLGEGMQAGSLLDSPERVRDYLRLTLQDPSRERFACLFLDAAHRLVSTRVMFEGTLTQTCAYPREIVRAALETHAAAVIVAHNHPSGVARPSTADLALTRQLGEALALLEIRLLDHFIVAGSSVYSLAEHGEV
ncbi:DNA repair protein RadC [Pandoraea nosoerga]|uniref:JAB domain-containing protein n=1 Tax=Pandoraea nosoerga TaxID=2508296 RepID=A0A5E4WXI2_9BURK|nr:MULTISPECIES: DNA repair protein RadC [Pandoraea]MBN4666336.1 DNA repair protein RadC [Pandoraea nosoerga]MBN4675985.1 DNA repair protein RadC [Pandoraea nosoerga]MBN4682080.1 DNA repair protein RadC [Pandoraea nosoerga]MBN4746469.1 DNA repair protein RadC [Pandoraea nosoerga]VVE28549.1 JAB domain-containing protein [Pandoraea nosoerga]